MPDKRRQTCSNCGRKASEVGLISWGGYCGECGPTIFNQACDEMHEHRGEYFLHWRRRSAAALGALLLDDLESQA